MSHASDEASRRFRLAMVGALTALMATGAGLGIWVIVMGYSPVPFADFWGQFPFIERSVRGDLRLADFWAQANEHRIFVPRIEFFLEYRFFHGTYIFLFSMIAASCVLVAGVLAATCWLETADWSLAWGAFCVATIAMLSPAAAENLTWSFQVGFVQVFLFAAIAFFALVSGIRAETALGRSSWTGLTVVSAVASTYSLANGILLWPVLLLLATVLRLGRRPTLFLASAAALIVFSYLWHFDFSTRRNLAHPFDELKYAAVFLGSPLRHAGTAVAGSAGALGAVLLTLLCVVAWRTRSERSMSTSVGTGLALFVFLSAGQTAAGRTYLGLTQALSSRYATAAFVFWLGLLVGFLRPILDRGYRSPRLALSLLGAAAVAALMVGLTALPSYASLRSTTIGKETTIVAFRTGVDDPSGTLTGVPSSAAISQALRWMQDHELGPWAPDGIVANELFTLATTRTSLRCRGRVETVDQVGGGLRLRGWVEAAPGEHTSAQLAVLDARGRIRGIGLVGAHRPDVKAAGASDSAWTGFVAYTRDPPPSAARLVLVGADHRTPVCRLVVPSAG